MWLDSFMQLKLGLMDVLHRADEIPSPEVFQDIPGTEFLRPVEFLAELLESEPVDSFRVEGPEDILPVADVDPLRCDLQAITAEP